MIIRNNPRWHFKNFRRNRCCFYSLKDEKPEQFNTARWIRVTRWRMGRMQVQMTKAG